MQLNIPSSSSLRYPSIAYVHQRKGYARRPRFSILRSVRRSSVTEASSTCDLSQGFRRSLLVLGGAAALWSCRSGTAFGKRWEKLKDRVSIPLSWYLGGFAFRFKLTGNPSSSTCTDFLAVADTGSPFMLVSKCLRPDCGSYCAEVGCFGGEGQPSDTPNTIEGYASGLVEIEWRKQGTLVFSSLSQDDIPVMLEDLNFGVQGKTIGFGGTGKAVYFGLIRDHMSDVQNSFLEQTPFRTLNFDLRSPGHEVLTLSKHHRDGLVSPLRLLDPRQWGDPVKHYCAIAKEVRVGGNAIGAYPITDSSSDDKPRQVLCIFDTGTTGASMTPSLYTAYWGMAREAARAGTAMSEARKLEVTFTLSDGKELNLKMYRGTHPEYGLGLDLVTPINEMAWAGIGPPDSIANYRVPGGVSEATRPFEDVMLLGVGFLAGRSITIDTEQDELRIC